MTNDDRIIILVQGERGPLRLNPGTADAALPSDNRMPVLAVPIFIRQSLHAIVLYGGHVDGQQLDPDEIALLQRLAIAAAAAYDHLDAEEARRSLELQSHKIEDLQRRLAAAQG